MVGHLVCSQKVVNSMLRVKFRFLNVFSNSMRTYLILIIQIRFKTLKIQTWNVIFVLKMTLLSVGHWLVQVLNINTFCISTINSRLYTKTLCVDIYSRTYKSPSQADAREIANYGKDDPYTATESNYQYPSMIASSAVAGLIGLIISYAIAIPLGSAMARHKNTWIDSFSTGALTFLLALPTIALVYIVRLIGSSIGLPDSFPILGAGDWRSYVLPAVILGLLGAPSTAIWIRRYMIDLQSQDFVRFARAKGLSEKEISNKHVFKNAMVPLVSGIPGAVIGVIGGATLTETVFAFPGMGKMLIDSVKASNNSMVVGLVFIFTCISIFSLFVGDIWMTMLDPRIKLTEKGGK